MDILCQFNFFFYHYKNNLFLTGNSRQSEVFRLELSQSLRQSTSKVPESSSASVSSAQNFTEVTEVRAFSH